jgi:hypothetical protein
LKNIAVGAGVLLGVALSMDAYAPPPSVSITVKVSSEAVV